MVNNGRIRESHWELIAIVRVRDDAGEMRRGKVRVKASRVVDELM